LLWIFVRETAGVLVHFLPPYSMPLLHRPMENGETWGTAVPFLHFSIFYIIGANGEWRNRGPLPDLCRSARLGWATLTAVPRRFALRAGWLHEVIAAAGTPTLVVTPVDGARFNEFWLRGLVRVPENFWGLPGTGLCLPNPNRSLVSALVGHAAIKSAFGPASSGAITRNANTGLFAA
jgi:hypothetical protein